MDTRGRRLASYCILRPSPPDEHECELLTFSSASSLHFTGNGGSARQVDCSLSANLQTAKLPITIEMKIDLDRKKSLSGNSTRPTAPLKPSPTRVGAHSCTRNRLKTHSSSCPSLRTEKMAAMTVSMTGVRASATPTTRRARIGSRQVAPSAFRRSAVATGRRSNSLVVGPRPLT